MAHIYNLKFHTGSAYGCGTNEAVLVRLYGYDGKKDGDFNCDYVSIDSSKDIDDHEARGRGAHHIYHCKTNEFLGKINKLVVYVNPFLTAENSAWYLENVEVTTQMGDSPETIETWNFPCKQWIGFPERCPEQIVHRFVELTESGSKVFDHDPEGERAELNYPIKNVLNDNNKIGANYDTTKDPYWSENVREIADRIN